MIDKYKSTLRDIFWHVMNSRGYKSNDMILDNVEDMICKVMTVKDLDEENEVAND